MPSWLRPNRLNPARTGVTITLVITLSTVALATGTGCGDDGPEAPATATAPEEAAQTPPPETRRENRRRAPTDRRPPEFDGTLEHTVTSWGRVRLSWTPASDDVTEPEEIGYELWGYGASDEEPEVIAVERGSTHWEGPVGATRTLWQAIALDTADRRSTPSAFNSLLPRPRRFDVLAAAWEGDLVDCREGAGAIWCVGEMGRWAEWRDGVWSEGALDTPETLRLVFGPEDSLELVTSWRRYRLDESRQPVAVDDVFDGSPQLPMRRFLYEPSGLAMWLDASGTVWASSGGSFRPLDDPLLIGSEAPCTSLLDMAFVGDSGFARCDDNRQFAMRISREGFVWNEMRDVEDLAGDELPQRDYFFGEGRALTALSWSGEIQRYDLTGWRSLVTASPGSAGAGSAAASTDDQHLVIGLGSELVRLNALGEKEIMLSIPGAERLVYVAPPEGEQVIISHRSGVYDAATGDEVFDEPPNGFVARVDGPEGLVGLLAEDPEVGLVRLDGSNTPVGGTDALAAPEMTLEGVVELAGGELLVAGDLGEAGGSIYRFTGSAWTEEPFLYPPPPPAPDPAAEAPAEPEPAEAEPAVPAPVVEPTIVDLVGVAASALPTSPPPRPPLHALDVWHESGAAIAVGDGGSAWLRIDGGWLSVPSGSNRPLLSARMTGPESFVIGGTGGTFLSCHLTNCEAITLRVGDIFRIVASPDGRVVAFGSDGIAQRSPEGEWARLDFTLEPPFPAGQAPGAVMAVGQGADATWLLTVDGALWFGRDGVYRAMAQIDGALALWTNAEGQAFVAGRETIFRVDPI